jgi:hypothetical protein
MRSVLPSSKSAAGLACLLILFAALTASADTKAGGSAPVIDEQPISRVATEGGPVSFFVVAHAPAAMTFEWRKGTVPLTNDSRVSGATNSVLNIDPLQLSDTSNYVVVVSAGGFATTSAPVSLVVSQLVAPQFPTGGTGTVINAYGQIGDVYRVEINANFSGYQTNGYMTNRTGVATYTARWPNDGVFRQVRTRYDRLLPVMSRPTPQDRASFTVYGKRNEVWRIDSSSDLFLWTPGITVTNTNGVVRFSDPQLQLPAMRFYRISLP